MNNRRIKLTASAMLLVIGGLCSAACHVPVGEFFNSYGCVSTEPNKDELVGVWIPDEATLEDIRTRGKYNPTVSTKLMLRADGSFEMENMPDWWKNGFGESSGGFESNSGAWKLSGAGGACWRIDLKVSNVGTSVGLLEHRFGGQPRYVIAIILGDPDSGEKMIFVKQ